MKNVITNAAEITVLAPIDNTYKTGGGPVSVGATVVVASKGPVGEVVQVRDSDWQQIFGKPLPKKASNMEGLRHLADATPKCNYVNVVRVVADDAKFPFVTFMHTNDKGAWATGTEYVPGDTIQHSDGTTVLRCVAEHTAAATEPLADGSAPEWEVFTSNAEQSADTYGTVLSVDETDMFILYPIDGDPCTNRKVYIEDVNTETKRFTFVFTDKDELGDEYEIERLTVGVGINDKDDLGRPAFIETAFEQQSDYFRVDFNDELTWDNIVETLQAIENTTATPKSFTFAGGTNGGEPTAQDWIDAWNKMRNESITVNLMFAAGNYDTDVLANCIDIADFRHCAFFMDVPPYLQHEAAITWLKDAGLKSRHARAYYAPFSASDRFRGGKTVWGVSGAAAAAKAVGNALFTGNVPGVHYCPAGIKRGVLARTGIKQLFPGDIINRDDLYDARINPVIASDSGGAVIDDDLTLHYLQNYSRFGWVNDILDYIDHRFVEAASYAKFEPDGLTYKILYDLTKEILDQLVTSGALVKPRNPEEDGTVPYILTIKQLEIDLWHVEWAVCPTGAARRIAGQPRLIK